jgi:putative ABC transport system substrate-binding protein
LKSHRGGLSFRLDRKTIQVCLIGSSHARHREFTTLLGGGAAWPLAARAQEPAKIARIGFLGTNTHAAVEERLDRFSDGPHDLGYVKGENLLFDFLWAEQKYARLAQFAAELIAFGSISS